MEKNRSKKLEARIKAPADKSGWTEGQVACSREREHGFDACQFLADRSAAKRPRRIYEPLPPEQQSCFLGGQVHSGSGLLQPVQILFFKGWPHFRHV